MAKQFIPSAVGEAPPETPHTPVRFLSSGISFMDKSDCLPGAGTSDEDSLCFQFIQQTLKAHRTFLSICTKERVIHWGANGFKALCTMYHQAQRPVSPRMLEAVAVSTKLVSWSTKQLSTNPNLSTVGSLASEQRSVCVHKFRLKAFEVTEIAGVQLFCRVSGRVPPFSPKPPTSLQCSLLNIHNRDVYVYRRIHLYIVNVYNVRLETSAVYSVLFTRRTPRFIIRSFTNA